MGVQAPETLPSTHDPEDLAADDGARSAPGVDGGRSAPNRGNDGRSAHTAPACRVGASTTVSPAESTVANAPRPLHRGHCKPANRALRPTGHCGQPATAPRHCTAATANPANRAL